MCYMTRRMDKIRGLDLRDLAPSPLVRRFGQQIVESAGTYPILDVPCGGGRNGVLLSYLGGQVIGIDIDLSKMERPRNTRNNEPFAGDLSRISLQQLDLVRDAWPYPPSSIGAVINVHFLHLPLLECFADSLVPGGFLVIETVPNRGGNYTSLPRVGQLRAALQESVAFLVYQERHAGPADSDTVTVSLVGVKRGNVTGVL